MGDWRECEPCELDEGKRKSGIDFFPRRPAAVAVGERREPEDWLEGMAKEGV